MTHVIRGLVSNKDLLKCHGADCDVKWKCWRYSRPTKFNGEQCIFIDGLSACEGKHFISEHPEITYEGLTGL